MQKHCKHKFTERKDDMQNHTMEQTIEIVEKNPLKIQKASKIS